MVINKRIISAAVFLIVVFAPALAGCGQGGQPGDPGQEGQPGQGARQGITRVAVINGPSGIGMVTLLDMPEKYNVSVYQSPDEVAGKVISGEVDIAALPVNLGAVIYNRTEGGVVALNAITKGNLYIVGHGDESIKSMRSLVGAEILAAGKGSTPEFILTKLLTS